MPGARSGKNEQSIESKVSTQQLQTRNVTPDETHSEDGNSRVDFVVTIGTRRYHRVSVQMAAKTGRILTSTSLEPR